MNKKEVIIEIIKHFIYLLEKSELEIASFAGENYGCFFNNKQNTAIKIKSEINSVFFLIKNAKNNLIL